MIAIKAHYDGERVILPAEMQGVQPGDVILVFDQENQTEAELIRGDEASAAASLSRHAMRKLMEFPRDDV